MASPETSPKPDHSTKPAPNAQPRKLTIERRTLPTWVVILFCITSMLLLVASLMELPGHVRGPWYSALFGVFKVVLWGFMIFIYVPEVIKRLNGKS